MYVPPRPKLLQKLFTKYLLEAIHFVIITKTLCIQLNKLERDHKHITKIIVSGNSFARISASMLCTHIYIYIYINIFKTMCASDACVVARMTACTCCVYDACVYSPGKREIVVGFFGTLSPVPVPSLQSIDSLL